MHVKGDAGLHREFQLSFSRKSFLDSNLHEGQDHSCQIPLLITNAQQGIIITYKGQLTDATALPSYISLILTLSATLTIFLVQSYSYEFRISALSKEKDVTTRWQYHTTFSPSSL